MAKGYMFDAKAVQRIADAVRKVERQLMDLTGKLRHRPPTLITYPVHDAAPTTTVGTTTSAEAAQTDDWDIYSADEGLKLMFASRPPVYSSTGDEVLYGYYRYAYIDRFGRWTKVSAETRVTVDTPVVCLP